MSVSIESVAMTSPPLLVENLSCISLFHDGVESFDSRGVQENGIGLLSQWHQDKAFGSEPAVDVAGFHQVAAWAQGDEARLWGGRMRCLYGCAAEFG
jgi:hypothetical protein